MRFRRVLIAAAVIASAVVVPSASAADPLRPDLGMAPIDDIHLALTASGQKQLRFSATIVNVGAGPFELNASRASTSSSFGVSQRVFNTDGTSSLVSTAASLFFAGDGHVHWHVKDLESYELLRLDNGVKVGTSAKSGFCFFDTTKYLASASPYWVYGPAGCGEESSLAITMGITVGWGDTYPWTLPDQYIDVTNLASGKYRLVAHADPAGWFVESRTDNNVTWVDIALTVNKKGNSKIRIIGRGPSA